MNNTIVEAFAYWGIVPESEAEMQVIIDRHHRRWVIEYPRNSEVFTLYCKLNRQPCSESEAREWLGLNFQRSIMSCAWAGLNHDGLVLGVTLPNSSVNASQLLSLFENMFLLRATLEMKFS
ncbi:type III secretion system chaperone family protein [Biostraticola tofi]|uniref:Tir chaperone family protein CesT n=1 Tax=Biostraticola tofi TaxID=466109 RepID=A0A4R3YPP4_9GAMM|nr:hypothetical protein [Biostraticola tofi]TCV94341.1 hypothetical protein EDC52_10782 [Biostraticola tofi]